jgi:predicted glycosyltransferase
MSDTMKIAFFINTPAHVHFHKYTIRELERQGHSVLVLARNYGDTVKLLDELGFKYFTYSDVPESKHGKIINFPFSVLSAFRYLRKRKPDLLIGIGLYSTYTSLLLRKPCVIFTDSESTNFQFTLLKPIVKAIITPSSFQMDLGSKHIKINTYKEFAYLHSDYFTSDPSIYNSLGIRKDSDFVLLRFNSFDAVHDLGIKGFTDQEKRTLVDEIGRHCKVFISSEVALPEDLQKYSIKLPKHKIHDVIYYAKMVVADTGTIITEAAVLGTPAIRYSTFAGETDLGNFVELEKKYNLIYTFNDSKKAIDKAIELVQLPQIKKEWMQKTDRLLSDKIDATKFMVSFIANYPESMSKAFEKNEMAGGSPVPMQE